MSDSHGFHSPAPVPLRPRRGWPGVTSFLFSVQSLQRPREAEKVPQDGTGTEEKQGYQRGGVAVSGTIQAKVEVFEEEEGVKTWEVLES